jgi:hypothetical protein
LPIFQGIEALVFQGFSRVETSFSTPALFRGVPKNDEYAIFQAFLKNQPPQIGKSRA